MQPAFSSRGIRKSALPNLERDGRSLRARGATCPWQATISRRVDGHRSVRTSPALGLVRLVASQQSFDLADFSDFVETICRALPCIRLILLIACETLDQQTASQCSRDWPDIGLLRWSAQQPGTGRSPVFWEVKRGLTSLHGLWVNHRVQGRAWRWLRMRSL